MSSETREPALSTPDRCLRCGYDLRGVADDQPCTECGLLAERSRRPSEALVDAAPQWLLGISLGVVLILVAICLLFAWYFGEAPLFQAITPAPVFVRPPLTSGGYLKRSPPMLLGLRLDFEIVGLVACDTAAVLLIVGVLLISRREPSAPVDRDRAARGAMRAFSTLPLIAMSVVHYSSFGTRLFRYWVSDWTEYVVAGLFTLGCAPLPPLLFAHLRRLANRVLHAQLAEHATIVGVGLSLTLLFMAGVMTTIAIVTQATSYPLYGSYAFLALQLIQSVAMVLFGGWSALNFLRFGIAFFRAYRGAQRRWNAADRAA